MREHPYFTRHCEGRTREYIDDLCNYAAVPERPMPLHVCDRIPDIEANRGDFDIVSFARRGDAILFRPGLLHGGGATATSQPRRTLSIRCFGDDVVYQPPLRPAPTYPGVSALIQPGEPLRGPWFPQRYPRPGG
jgi:hypothetical protein